MLLLAFLSDLRSSSYGLLRIVCALSDHVAKASHGVKRSSSGFLIRDGGGL